MKGNAEIIKKVILPTSRQIIATDCSFIKKKRSPIHPHQRSLIQKINQPAIIYPMSFAQISDIKI